MKKPSALIRRTVTVFILILFIISTAACSVKVSGEGETRVETREDANTLARAFLAESLKKTNVDMTVTVNGEVATSFVRDGNTAKVFTPETGDAYAYIEGGKYCVAYTSGENKGVYESKESYYDPVIDGLRFWLELFLVSEDGSVNSDWDFSAVQTDKEENNNTDSTFELNAEGKDGSQAVKATSHNGLVDRIEAEYNDGTGSENYVIEIKYDNSIIILPDFSGYDHNVFEG